MILTHLIAAGVGFCAGAFTLSVAIAWFFSE